MKMFPKPKRSGRATEELIKETRQLKRQLAVMSVRLDTFHKQLQKEVDRLTNTSDEP